MDTSQSLNENTVVSIEDQWNTAAAATGAEARKTKVKGSAISLHVQQSFPRAWQHILP
jgi:hypothetical protein